MHDLLIVLFTYF